MTPTKPCRVCGKPIEHKRLTTTGKFWFPKQCVDCRHVCVEADLRRKRMSESKLGEKHNNYKPIGTTRIVTSARKRNSYRQIKIAPLTWRYEHRIVIEAHLGRRLNTSEHIHHVNGDGLDNRLENLMVVDNATHRKLHKIEGLWSKMYKCCVTCGEASSPHASGGECRRCNSKRRYHANKYQH